MSSASCWGESPVPIVGIGWVVEFKAAFEDTFDAAFIAAGPFVVMVMLFIPKHKQRWTINLIGR